MVDKENWVVDKESWVVEMEVSEVVMVSEVVEDYKESHYKESCLLQYSHQQWMYPLQ